MRVSSRLLTFGALAAATLAAAPPARALDVVSGEILPGWRRADGAHLAGLRLTLDPGWKTYWRAPGDAGIPPEFDWSGSRNLGGVQIAWPVPEVFDQNGMRSIVYSDEVVLPLRVTPARAGEAVTLSAEISLGVCEDICVPAEIAVEGTLPASGGAPDPAIAAALAARPLDAAEAGVTGVDCTVTGGAHGLTLRAEVALPGAEATTAAVIEPGAPEIWASEPDLAHPAPGRVVATSDLAHRDGGAFALERSAVRLTLLAPGRAVDIRGCTGG